MDYKRNSVIALFLDGKSQTAIVQELKHLNVNKMFVYRTIKRYNDTGSILVRHSGGQAKTVTTPAMVKKVKEHLQRNPGQSGRQMAEELNISSKSIQRIFNDVLHVKKVKLQDLTDDQKKVELGTTKKSKRRKTADNSEEEAHTAQAHASEQNDMAHSMELSHKNLATRNWETWTETR